MSLQHLQIKVKLNILSNTTTKKKKSKNANENKCIKMKTFAIKIITVFNFASKIIWKKTNNNNSTNLEWKKLNILYKNKRCKEN